MGSPVLCGPVRCERRFLGATNAPGARRLQGVVRRTGPPALTADRSWLEVAEALGVKVEAIR